MSGFLRRWAERKAAHEAAPAPDQDIEAEDLTSASMAATPGETEPALSSEEVAARLAALPALEEIGPETDIRPFLQSFVPTAMRNAAMRRAWTADPIISTHLDVARDYAWEFNMGELPVGFSRSLGSDSLRRSLDALGEIGAEPRESARSAVEAEAEEPNPEPSSQPVSPSPAPQAEEDCRKDISPTRDEVEEKVAPSNLKLRPRHGAALPD